MGKRAIALVVFSVPTSLQGNYEVLILPCYKQRDTCRGHHFTPLSLYREL
jgi:hypothetical protein